MKKITLLMKFLSHNLTWIVVIAGIALITFIDENSLLQLFKNDLRKRELKEQIDELNRQYERDEAQLYELRHNPDAVTRVAREKYFMKMDDEDVFVIREE